MGDRKTTPSEGFVRGVFRKVFLATLRLLSPKKTVRKAGRIRYSGSRINLLAAPSQPDGQWHNVTAFVLVDSDGFAPVFHRTSRNSCCFYVSETYRMTASESMAICMDAPLEPTVQTRQGRGGMTEWLGRASCRGDIHGARKKLGANRKLPGADWGANWSGNKSKKRMEAICLLPSANF